MIKYGFKITDGKIYDTKIHSFKIERIIKDNNILYTMIPCYYKRLYLFEALLNYYSKEITFQILNYNKFLRIQRDKYNADKKSHYMTNCAVIYNYPPTYLTQRKFYLYKTCQHLKKNIDNESNTTYSNQYSF